VQLVELPLPESKQLGPTNPVALPPKENVTCPVGGVGVALVSVTVAVQMETWFTAIGVSQLTLVVVGCRGAELTVMVNGVRVLLPL
jgi:hypothetical protein